MPTCSKPFAKPKARRDGPVLWLPCDRPGPTWAQDTGDVYDLSRGYAAGVRSTGCVYGGSPWGGCLAFSGTGHLDMGASFAAAAFTVSCWFYPAVLTRGDLVTVWTTGTITDGFNLLYGSTSGKPQLFTFGGNSGVGADAVAINTWNHVVGTFGAGTLSVYLNGKFQASAGGSASAGSTPVVRVGNNQNGDGQFSGSIRDVRLYRRALSAAEILSVYLGTDLSPPRNRFARYAGRLPVASGNPAALLAGAF